MRRATLAIALAAVALLAPASAQGAKVSETALGVPLPDGAGSGPQFILGNATQTFTLKGSKVRRRQVLDVDVTLNATTAPGTTSSLQGVRMTLIAPSGERAAVASLQQIPVNNWVDLKVDDQSIFFACDPEEIISSRCNYGPAGGTLTGTIHGTFNRFFRGLNPKGTWRLFWEDASFAPPGRPPTAIGETTLEVKTGKKFAKEGK